MAAPAINPTIAACERKSTRNPNLQVVQEWTNCVRMKIEITFQKVAVKTSLLINLPENSKCSLEDSGKKCHGEHKISVSNRIGHRIFYLLNQGG